MNRLTCFTLIFVALSGDVCRAEFHYVSTNGGCVSPYTTWENAATSIAAAVSVCGANDTIVVSNGTYNISSTIGLGGAKTYTITSLYGAASTILDGNGQEMRCFTIGNTATVARVYGLTLTNFVFSIAGGAGFYVYPGSLFLDSCVFGGNRAGYGGAVWANCYASHIQLRLVVTNCEFYGNISMRVNNYSGGAIFYNNGGAPAESCVMQVDNTVFYDNASTNGGYGGAIFLGGSTITGEFRNCVFERNRVSGGNGSGGVISSEYSGGCFLSNCRFVSNSAASGAGGAYSGGGTMENCLFEGNTNAGNGGAIRCGGGVMRNCRILNNRAGGYGGGIWGGASLEVHDSWIEDNCASNNGGGIYVASLLRNCVIAHNSTVSAASWGGGVSGADQAVNCTIVSNHSAYVAGGVSRPWCNNCIIYYNTSGDVINSNYWNADTVVRPWTNCVTGPDPATRTIGGTNCITEPPMFGTASERFKPVQDSPAVNAGVNQEWMTGAVDSDGHPRIAEFIVDIGAFEYHPPGTVWLLW